MGACTETVEWWMNSESESWWWLRWVTDAGKNF